MNTVSALSRTEIDLVHSLLTNKNSVHFTPMSGKPGLNLSLRISDLLALKFADLDLEARSLTLIESKTGKKKTLRLNAAAVAVIARRQQKHPADAWLFQVHSNRARHNPVSRVSVSRVSKEAGDLLGLSVNIHSMRKSRGKAMFDADVPIEKIAKVLNHSDTGVTLRYLGITREAVLQTYDDFEL